MLYRSSMLSASMYERFVYLSRSRSCRPSYARSPGFKAGMLWTGRSFSQSHPNRLSRDRFSSMSTTTCSIWPMGPSIEPVGSVMGVLPRWPGSVPSLPLLVRCAGLHGTGAAEDRPNMQSRRLGPSPIRRTHVGARGTPVTGDSRWFYLARVFRLVKSLRFDDIDEAGGRPPATPPAPTTRSGHGRRGGRRERAADVEVVVEALQSGLR
jgi:hypothetical protein